MDVTAELNLTKWLLDEDINGAVLASFVAIEFLLSLPISLFILVHSIYNAKETLRKSSTIFFFSFILSNLLMVVFYMPFTIAAASAGEWIFGSTDAVRNIFCHIHGFIFVYGTVISFDTLSVISVDRFLTVARSDFHKKFMTWKVAHGIMVFVWVSLFHANVRSF